MERDGNDRATASRYAVPALEKGLDVLELLSDRSESMSQTDIARGLGRNVSEVFRTLSALEGRGYIRRTPSGQYRLTLRLFEMSRTHSPYEELLRVALPVMRDLSAEVRETCHLTTLRDGAIVVLAQNESPKPVRLSVEVGSSHSPLATTSGRILLAAMEDGSRRDFLRDYTAFATWQEAERSAFLARVAEIAGRGYEIARDERHQGGLDIGVLVGTATSTMKAALIVATLRSGSGPDAEGIRTALARAANRINRLLGVVRPLSTLSEGQE